MKPNLIVRKGNKFVIDETKILPYMKKSKDLVQAAVSIAATELKEHPQDDKDAVTKLQDLNNRVYELLSAWKVYKG